MISIEVTDKHKVKLIKMCKYFYPELQRKAARNAKKWLNQENQKASDYHIGFRLSEEFSPTLYCSYPIEYDYHTHLLPPEDESKDCGINWFEFCYRFIMPKLNDIYVEKYIKSAERKAFKENNYPAGLPLDWIDIWDKRPFIQFNNNLNGIIPKKHPIEYLYEEFKLLKP